MKKINEIALRINSPYVKDDCVQTSLSYRDYLMLFGNKDIMYYRNLLESDVFPNNINSYLKDKRRKDFPYSSIPEYVRRVIFQKTHFTQQILEFEKPYIRVSDGNIIKTTAFKDGNDAIVHSKYITHIYDEAQSVSLTREQFETYLASGSLPGIDKRYYSKVYTFNGRGLLSTFRKDSPYFNASVKEEAEWVSEEKAYLQEEVNKKFSGNANAELLAAISSLTAVEPFDLNAGIMVKIADNGMMKIELFEPRFIRPNQYEITVSNIPLTFESLNAIKTRIGFLRTESNPRINLSLNKEVTKEQLRKEREKVHYLSQLHRQ